MPNFSQRPAANAPESLLESVRQCWLLVRASRGTPAPDAAYLAGFIEGLDAPERDKLQSILALAARGPDCFYGDDRALEKALLDRRLPHVLARRGAHGRGWAPAKADHSFKDAARSLPLRAWREVTRRFRDGHTERW